MTGRTSAVAWARPRESLETLGKAVEASGRWTRWQVLFVRDRTVVMLGVEATDVGSDVRRSREGLRKVWKGNVALGKENTVELH